MKVQFEINKSKTATFEQILKYVSSFNTEARFKFSENMLQINTLDLSKTYATTIKIKKEFFENFELSKPVEFCLKVEYIYKIFKRMKSQNCIFLVNDKERTISTEKRKFCFDLYDVDQDFLETVKIEHKNSFIIESKKLNEVFEDVKIIQYADNISMKIKKDGVMFTGKGETRIDYENVCNDIEIKTFDTEQVSRFSIELFSKITPTYFSEYNIKLGQDLPVIVEYTNKEKTIYLNSFLAPRVDND